MTEQIPIWVLIPLLFVPLFLALWLFVTATLAVLAGWSRLQVHYPDRDDAALATLGFQSGQMGNFLLIGVAYGKCLHFDVCGTGLRLRIWKPLGPFCRPFFVPWQEIHVERMRFILFSWFRMTFGAPRQGNLSVSSRAGRDLAQLSGGLLKMPNPAP